MGYLEELAVDGLILKWALKECGEWLWIRFT
jgi:hypothetical protein